MGKSHKKFKKNLNPFFKKKSKKYKIRHKYICTLCERIVVNHEHIKTRKNYPFGRKSKPIVYKEHRIDGGCLVELKRKKKDF